ncbi:HtaA domain-containing protein [Nocardioides sp. LHD-245]|uniref:HtaA domain-containing protein n=1 Tax=Nocardioides sp. LHD-245 TaxID=3051387 RepID=UPI0027DEDAF3|nr:HtaA domain-containing protein [Nocardioides sp. LHD-245]
MARWALALASATSLGSLGLVTVATAPAQAAVTPITAGPGLDWGVKASWRTYIGEGGTTLADGATRNEDGTFHFPVAGGSYDDATRTTLLELDGSVEFLGHCHGIGGTHARPCDLDLTFSDVRVEISEDRASLFVDAASRPIAGGDVVTFDDVALVDLDVEDAEPVVAGGTARWSDLAATMTPDGERIFNYAAGTVVDPVTFAYAGPGGRPVGETWDVAGQTVYEAVAADPQPSALPSRIVGRLSSGELVGWSSATYQIAVLDPATLAPLSAWVGGPGVTGNILRDSIAIDPATDTIFASNVTNNLDDRRLATFHWDGSTLAMTEVAGGYAPDLVADSGSGATWDEANDRYVIARTRSATATDLWEVVDLAGTWTARKLGPVTLSSPGASTWENAIVNLVAVPDGANKSAILATSLFGVRPLQRLAQVGSAFRGEPLAEAGDILPDRILRTRDGVYAVAGADKAVFIPLVGYADARRLGTATDPVSFLVGSDSNRNRSMLTVDEASNTLIGVTDSNQNVTRVERGQIVSRGGLTTGAYGDNALLGLDADGDILGVRGGQLETLRVIAQSPAFTQQPSAPVADLTGASATVTIAAEVTGTPAPALIWQTRIPGQPWAEVTAGADGATLTAVVTAADLGRQYRLVAENAGGRVASDRVSLSLRTPPRIMVQPADVSVAPGEDVELKVMPDGTPAPDVRWQQRIGGVWHDVPGQDAATLRLEDVDASLSGTAFRARLSNAVGSVVSDRATVTVAAPSTDPREITGGTVDWGVKASFRGYIGGPIAHGSVTTEGGVVVNDDGSFAFPVVDGAWDPAGTSTVELGGSVHFTGHDTGAGPQLDLRITDPRLVIGADGSTLVADVVSRGLASGELATYDDVVLADLATTDRVRALGDTLSVVTVPASLTAAGAPAFADFYPAGTELDPIDGTIELGAVIEEPGTEPEPVGTTTGLLVAGATPYGQEVGVQVAVRAADRRAVDGTVELGLAGRTWTVPVVDGVASTAVPAGTAPGVHRLEARFPGADGLQASSGVGRVQIAKATPGVRATLPKKRVSRTARAKVAVVASLPGSPLPVTGRVVVRVDGKVVKRGPLAPNVRGRTVLRLPRLSAGTHRVTVTVAADPRFRAATSKAVVLRVR